MTQPSYGIRPNAPAPSSSPGASGGVLVAPRPSQAPAEGAAPTAASTAAPRNTTVAGDLSPRADNGDDAAVDPASPSSEAAVVGLPRELSLAELFPAEAAMGAAQRDVVLDQDELAAGQGRGLGTDSRSSPDSIPLVAGIVVTLAVLLSAGGFLWWRNRDRHWQPA